MSAEIRDAETAVIGVALQGLPGLDDLLDKLTGADFYSPSRGAVWEAIRAVHNSGIRPDPITVRAEVDKLKLREFDPVWLVDAMQTAYTVASADHYADQILIAAGLRDIGRAAAGISQIATTPTDDLPAAQERARQLIDDATQGRHISRARKLADLLPAALDVAQHGQAGMLSTPWPDLDRFIGGLAPGRLIVFGARPGVGKSLAGTNLALHMAHKHKHGVLLASLEMPELEVMQRILAAFAKANLTGLQMGQTAEESWNKIAAASDEICQMPLVVDDTPAQTVTHIRRMARNVQRERDDLALIVVDYLQLVRPSDPRLPRVEQLGEISRGLKLMARETGACVVAMAQLNRNASTASDGPRMTDLRESGSIENDADQVVLMHQPNQDMPELELLIDKNRHGPKGRAQLAVWGHYARLDSMTWNPTGAIR